MADVRFACMCAPPGYIWGVFTLLYFAIKKQEKYMCTRDGHACYVLVRSSPVLPIFQILKFCATKLFFLWRHRHYFVGIY